MQNLAQKIVSCKIVNSDKVSVLGRIAIVTPT